MAEEVIWADGHFEVDPSRLENVPGQRMDLAERQRIIAQRGAYLDWMHDHFADRIVEPPEGYPEIETGHGS